jgi:membrane fusion protein (multidrug efflux system)
MAIKGKRRKVIIGVVVMVVFAGGVGAYAALSGSGSKPAADAPVTLDFLASQLAQPRQRRLAFELVLPGTVEALTQATVRSRLSAVILAVDVREGDAVTQGQVVTQFETAPLRALLAERSAALASAQANLEQTQRTREANAQLVQRNFITQNAFDSADAAFQAQSANVAAARAQLAQTQLQLDDAIVRAPITGVVARRYVQSGEKVGMDAQLLQIVNLSRLEVRAQAAVADVARVKPGTAAEVQIEGLAGERYQGHVERINPSADPGSRSIDLYVAFPNEHALVRTGMYANVRLRLTADRETTTLPLTAVQTEAGQSFVWSVKDGHLARHAVSLGRRDEPSQLVEVLGGVTAGDQVLASRFDDLRDGGPARIVASKEVAAKDGAAKAGDANAGGASDGSSKN